MTRSIRASTTSSTVKSKRMASLGKKRRLVRRKTSVSSILDTPEGNFTYPSAEKPARLEFHDRSLTRHPARAGTSKRGRGTTPGKSKTRGLVMGLNYIGTSSALSGCIPDAEAWKALLTKSFGLDECLFMTDLTAFSPTRKNMIRAIKTMVRLVCRDGGTLFFTYSGHGSQQVNVTTSRTGTHKWWDRQQARGRHHPTRLRSTTEGDYEADGYDESLVPLDYAVNGQIIDDTLNELIIKEISKCGREDVKCICIIDACHSGSALDAAHSYDVVDGKIKHERVRDSFGDFAANVVMISGCRDSQTSSDVTVGGESFGALSKALISVLDECDGKITNGDLLLRVNEVLAPHTQVAQMSSERKLDMDAMIDW